MKHLKLYQFLRIAVFVVCSTGALFSIYWGWSNNNFVSFIWVFAVSVITLSFSYVYIPGKIYTYREFERATNAASWKYAVHAKWKFKSGYLHEMNTGLNEKMYLVYDERDLGKVLKEKTPAELEAYNK